MSPQSKFLFLYQVLLLFQVCFFFCSKCCFFLFQVLPSVPSLVSATFFSVPNIIAAFQVFVLCVALLGHRKFEMWKQTFTVPHYGRHLNLFSGFLNKYCGREPGKKQDVFSAPSVMKCTSGFRQTVCRSLLPPNGRISIDRVISQHIS